MQKNSQSSNYNHLFVNYSPEILSFLCNYENNAPLISFQYFKESSFEDKESYLSSTINSDKWKFWYSTMLNSFLFFGCFSHIKRNKVENGTSKLYYTYNCKRNTTESFTQRRKFVNSRFIVTRRKNESMNRRGLTYFVVSASTNRRARRSIDKSRNGSPGWFIKIAVRYLRGDSRRSRRRNRGLEDSSNALLSDKLVNRFTRSWICDHR